MNKPKPEYQRAVEVALRSLHIVSMGIVLGGIAAGGTRQTLRLFIVATLATGALLLATTLARGCLRLSQGAGAALLLKLALLGLGNLFEGARLECYVAATLLTSIGSHMPATWRHYPVADGLRALAGLGRRTS
ncbi:MAG TPA: hypothetical protein VLW85_23500 [Myxococcales bacterium]|nr:hypothetical protein [Myxococcales bacterium]